MTGSVCSFLMRSLQQGVKAAIAIALLAAQAAGAADNFPPPGQCPQQRTTKSAPPEILNTVNFLAQDADSINRGKQLYRTKAGTTSCVTCHGDHGDGKGIMANRFAPPPRNFKCAETMRDVPDGQLYWIIKNGSDGTAMPATKSLGKWTDSEIWQVVAYIRTFAR